MVTRRIKYKTAWEKDCKSGDQLQSFHIFHVCHENNSQLESVDRQLSIYYIIWFSSVPYKAVISEG